MLDVQEWNGSTFAMLHRWDAREVILDRAEAIKF